jgi:hypothetical protein
MLSQNQINSSLVRTDTYDVNQQKAPQVLFAYIC